MNSIDTNSKQQRNFFFLMGSVFIAWGSWKYFAKSHSWGILPVAAGVTLFLLELVFTRLGARSFHLWMRFAALLGHINTTILITLVFVLVLTPVGIIRRLLGKSLFSRIGIYRIRKSSFEPLDTPSIESYASPF